MKSLSIFVFILSFVLNQPALAETAIGTTSSPTSSSSSSGTNSTAKQSAGSAGMAMIANATAAAGFFAAASAAPPPKKPIYYALAAASVAAGLMMSGGKSNAGAVDKSTLALPSMGGGSGYTHGAGFDGGEGGVGADLLDLQQDLAEVGYVLSPDGSSLSTPSGSVSTAAIASGNAPGFEMTDDVKSKMDEIAADALAKASGNRVVPIGLQDGGGGGGGSMGGGETPAGSRFDMAAYLKGLKNRDPSSITGLSKKLGEDNIGIKSDNIFEMVSRQYKRKQSQSAFIK